MSFMFHPYPYVDPDAVNPIHAPESVKNGLVKGPQSVAKEIARQIKAGKTRVGIDCYAGFAPFLAARSPSGCGLRTAVALSGLSSSSVLRTLFAACPASRRRLRTALPLRGVLALGASHPFCGLPRFASRASDCAAAARRARPRCFAPFLANRNPGPKPGA